MRGKIFYSKWSLSIAVAAFLTFFGCNKDNENNVTFDNQSSDAFTTEETIENTFDVVESITEAGLNYASNNGGRIAENTELACASITFVNNKPSGKLTIDFGETGCEGPDGKLRTGIVVVEYTGNWLVQGTKITTTLDNFSVDGIKVAGTRELTNLGLENSVLTFQDVITGGKITWSNDAFATREVNRTTKWHFGSDLNNIQLEVEGSANGVTAEGVAYSSVITEPVLFKSECRQSNTIYFPAQGKKTITLTDHPNAPAIYVDYGSGDCDTNFMVTIGDNSNSYTLSDLSK